MWEKETSEQSASSHDSRKVFTALRCSRHGYPSPQARVGKTVGCSLRGAPLWIGCPAVRNALPLELIVPPRLSRFAPLSERTTLMHSPPPQLLRGANGTATGNRQLFLEGCQIMALAHACLVSLPLPFLTGAQSDVACVVSCVCPRRLILRQPPS